MIFYDLKKPLELLSYYNTGLIMTRYRSFKMKYIVFVDKRKNAFRSVS